MVDNRTFETNSSAPFLAKILVTIDQCQEPLLCGQVKTTVTSSSETWVERLMNNVVFQFRRTLDTSPGKLLYHRISPFVRETLLL